MYYTNEVAARRQLVMLVLLAVAVVIILAGLAAIFLYSVVW